MTIINFDHNACNGDRLCSLDCPVGIIGFDTQTKRPFLLEDRADYCIRCGHCEAICPRQAIRLTFWPTAERQKSDAALLPSTEQMEQLIKGRRSVRLYKKTPVAHESIEELIRLARYAPSAKNLQLLKWLVIDNADEIKKLSQEVIAWMEHGLANNDPMAKILGFGNALKSWKNGGDPIFRGAPGLVIISSPEAYFMGAVDSAIAMTTFELAASARNIGTCWAGFFMICVKHWQPLRQALKLFDGYEATSALMIGQPRYRYENIPERNPADITWR